MTVLHKKSIHTTTFPSIQFQSLIDNRHRFEPSCTFARRFESMSKLYTIEKPLHSTFYNIRMIKLCKYKNIEWHNNIMK